MKPVVLTDRELANTPWSEGGPGVVEFWSFRSETCRIVAPRIADLARKLEGRAKVYKVNVDDNPRLTAYFRVPLVPCVVLIRSDGTEIAMYENFDVDEILSLVKEES